MFGQSGTAPDLDVDLGRARFLATLLDSKFEVAGIRFGLDAIVGLIPVVGDTITTLAATYPIYVANRHGLGKVVQTRMAMNVLADWAVGLVPVVGDVIDVAFKANLKNLTLLEAAVAKKRRGEVLR
jgi:hypothetical protein